jgi:hypothetical protein
MTARRLLVTPLVLLAGALVMMVMIHLGVRIASADVAPGEVVLLDAGPLDAVVAPIDAVAPEVYVPARTDAPTLPDPQASPVESASLLWRLYKAGHLIPALVLLAFFGLTLAQRRVAWLRTGYRKLVVASALAGLAMLAERAAEGTTPSLPMLMGAFGVALALYTRGDAPPPAETEKA